MSAKQTLLFGGKRYLYYVCKFLIIRATSKEMEQIISIPWWIHAFRHNVHIKDAFLNTLYSSQFKSEKFIKRVLKSLLTDLSYSLECSILIHVYRYLKCI